MPNWCTIRLTIHGPHPEQVEALIFNPETNEPDFEVLLPMPAILKRVRMPVRKGVNGRTMLMSDPNVMISKAIEATEEQQAELDALPCDSWYEWACQNWGTKWNACHTTPGDLTFATAWGLPDGWLTALEEALPPAHQVDCYAEFEGGERPLTVHLTS